MEEVESLPLFPVLHEVMHIHELQYMHAVLRSRTADARERDYAMRVICAVMARMPETGEEYDTHLTEASAMYFSDIYAGQFDD